MITPLTELTCWIFQASSSTEREKYDVVVKTDISVEDNGNPPPVGNEVVATDTAESKTTDTVDSKSEINADKDVPPINTLIQAHLYSFKRARDE